MRTNRRHRRETRDLDQRMATKVPRASLPVTTADAKKHLEIASGDASHDDQLDELIERATDQWEHDTGSVTLTTTFTMALENFPDAWVVELPRRPLISVSSITYRDGATAAATLSSSLYRASLVGSRIILNYGERWPAIPDQTDAVEITFVAGHATAADVPTIAKQAILLQVGRWFEDRDMLVTDTRDAAYEKLATRFMRSSYP